MKLGILLVMASLAFPACAAPEKEPVATASADTEETVPDESPRVALDTDKGKIVVELNAIKAPKSVESFLDNVRTGFYDGTVFHRVIAGFMIQGGGYDVEGRLKPTNKMVVNEADNGLGNVRGTIAMARKNDPNSASVQFYINHVDNPSLDHTGKSLQGWGYAVFGLVVEGMEVVDAIAASPPNRKNPPVVIRSASVLTDSEGGS